MTQREVQDRHLGSLSHDEAIRYVRSLMCSPLGAEIVEEQIIRPFGYVRHPQAARQEERCSHCEGRGWVPATEPPHMYWCPRDYCGWTGSRRPTGGACPECLLGNDERVMVIEG